MAENQFVSTVEALFKGMDQFVTTKTVVGDAVKVDDAIKNGVTKLVNIKQQDAVTKVLDMVPDFVNKFAGGKKEEVSEKAMETAQEIAAAGEEADAKAE